MSRKASLIVMLLVFVTSTLWATVVFAENAAVAERQSPGSIDSAGVIRGYTAADIRAERTYSVAGVRVASDVLIVVIDIADRGVPWARQTLRARFQDGRLMPLETISFRLLY